jgi:F0F1-type ATP synthase assembly protein I
MNNNPSSPEKKSDQLASSRSFMQYTSLAFQMIAVIVLGALGGKYLDKIWFTDINHGKNGFPVCTFVGTLGGLGASLYYAIRSLLKK